jgi:hypothetical protein
VSRGVTVKVECWVRSAEHRESGFGWDMVLACGHEASIADGPAPVDMRCGLCEIDCDELIDRLAEERADGRTS